MTKRVAWLVSCALFVSGLISPTSSWAATGKPPAAASRLVALAASILPNLTRAEVALLEHADVKNLGRGQYAVAGTNVDPDDSSNDPANAAQWGHEREIRASLIRWMSVDPDAIRQIDPQGIRVLGARIVGSIDLSGVRVPFGIVLRNCAIPQAMELNSSEIPALDLQGSYTASIHGSAINVANWVWLAQVHLTGIVNLQGATIGAFGAWGGHLEYASEPGYYLAPLRGVLNLDNANIKGSVLLMDGFEADGEVDLLQARIGGDLVCVSGHFFNPGNIAINASGADVSGSFVLASAGVTGFAFKHGGSVRIQGVLLSRGAHIGSSFLADQVVFSGPLAPPLNFGGPVGIPVGLSAGRMRVDGDFLWGDVKLNGGQLDLTGATIPVLADMESSWPASGNLHIDNLTYPAFGVDVPRDADARLRWIALQPGYHPQPYRQLAKVLRENGDEKGAVSVLVAEGDARYRRMGFLGRLLGHFLKYTIGYGHRPLLALFWSFGVVLVGWAMVSIGWRAGVMTRSWPEYKPADLAKSHEELHPLLYSLDTFLPVVDLHQEYYWWPDAAASGTVTIFGQSFSFSGRLLRHYLWLQIIAGWLLSAVFIAGVTGLIRND